MAIPSDSSGNFPRIDINQFKGMDERERQFYLQSAFPLNANTLTKATGIKFLHQLSEPVFGITQTNDSRKNIIIQLHTKVVLMSEDEFFNRVAYVPDLTPIAEDEEENMAQAIITHSATAGTHGGSYSSPNVWQQAPLDAAFASQVNPDGSAASFATVTGNQITLAAGCYRLRGWSKMSHATGSTRCAARVYDITNSQPLWNGLSNETSGGEIIGENNDNKELHFMGFINILVPTIIEIQGLMITAQSSTGFGAAKNTTGFTLSKEIYRYLEILKTA